MQRRDGTCEHVAVVDDAPCFFVYGTLMPGEPRWPALRPYATSWGRATAMGRLWDTGRGYPAVRFDEGAEAIPGIVVTLAPDLAADAVAILDRIEGEGVLYRRVDVVTSAGPAMSYEWLGATDGLAPLAKGWTAARRTRAARP